MRLYDYRIKQVNHDRIIGYGKIFNGEIYKVYNKDDKYLFSIETPYKASKNRIKRIIWLNIFGTEIAF